MTFYNTSNNSKQVLGHLLRHAAHSGGVSEQCLTSPPTQYRLYGRRFLQVKRPNQQYQSTEGESTKENNTKNKKKTENIHTLTIVYK